MGKLVTTTQLAEILGVSRTTLDKAVKSGRLTVKTRDARGRPKFDVELAVREYERRGQSHGEGKNRGGRPSVSERDSSATASFSMPPLEGQDFALLIEKLATLTPAQQLVQVDVIKKLRDSRRIELALMKEEGALIPIDRVRSQGVELGTVLMGTLTALPGRLSQPLAAMTDPHEVHEMLMREVEQMVANVRKHCGVDVPADDSCEKGYD